jgi:hypothetical protein
MRKAGKNSFKIYGAVFGRTSSVTHSHCCRLPVRWPTPQCEGHTEIAEGRLLHCHCVQAAESREITPYKWGHPDTKRREACRFTPAGSIFFQRNGQQPRQMVLSLASNFEFSAASISTAWP